MRKIASILPQGLRCRFLRRHLISFLPADAGFETVSLVDDSSSAIPLFVTFVKRGSSIELRLGLQRILGSRFLYQLLYARLPVVLRIFAQSSPEVAAAAADLADAGDPPAGGMVFSSARRDLLLVPDAVFFNSRGYSRYRAARLCRAWSARDGTVLWRGSATGSGACSAQIMASDNHDLRQRVRMCLMLRSVPGVDAKITKLESHATMVDRQRLVEAGILGRRITQKRWGAYKFAIDIDGHTNAWSNLFVRLLLGCCVLKIASEKGFRQWYYDELRAGQHFVPVRADMSDLLEKIDWCQKHDAECQQIAVAGRAFASARTADTEVAAAVSQLEMARRSVART